MSKSFLLNILNIETLFKEEKQNTKTTYSNGTCLKQHSYWTLSDCGKLYFILLKSVLRKANLFYHELLAYGDSYVWILRHPINIGVNNCRNFFLHKKRLWQMNSTCDVLGLAWQAVTGLECKGERYFLAIQEKRLALRPLIIFCQNGSLLLTPWEFKCEWRDMHFSSLEHTAALKWTSWDFW